MSARPRSQLSARARLWLLFLALALATCGVLAGGAWLAGRNDLPAELPWLLAALSLLGGQALVWLLL
jgi:hypothetical protein